MKILRYVLILFLTPIMVPALPAQVTVAPTKVFLDSDSRFGTFFVFNETPAAQEVTIDFRFGYPRTDSLGNGSMVYGETLRGADRSMASWIQAFPRQFILPPGERQTVRLTVRPGGEMQDGVYWTRLVTTSTPQSVPVDTIGEGIAAQIIFRLQQITSVFYKHGDVRTGVEPGPVEVALDSSRLRLLLPLTRTGTAPFLGTAALQIRNAEGRIVLEDEQRVEAYFESVASIEVDRTELAPGNYTAEIEITATRGDIAPEDRMPIEPVVIRFQLHIPEE